MKKNFINFFKIYNIIKIIFLESKINPHFDLIASKVDGLCQIMNVVVSISKLCGICGVDGNVTTYF